MFLGVLLLFLLVVRLILLLPFICDVFGLSLRLSLRLLPASALASASASALVSASASASFNLSFSLPRPQPQPPATQNFPTSQRRLKLCRQHQHTTSIVMSSLTSCSGRYRSHFSGKSWTPQHVPPTRPEPKDTARSCTVLSCTAHSRTVRARYTKPHILWIQGACTVASSFVCTSQFVEMTFVGFPGHTHGFKLSSAVFKSFLLACARKPQNPRQILCPLVQLMSAPQNTTLPKVRRTAKLFSRDDICEKKKRVSETEVHSSKCAHF